MRISTSVLVSVSCNTPELISCILYPRRRIVKRRVASRRVVNVGSRSSVLQHQHEKVFCIPIFPITIMSQLCHGYPDCVSQFSRIRNIRQYPEYPALTGSSVTLCHACNPVIIGFTKTPITSSIHIHFRPDFARFSHSHKGCYNTSQSTYFRHSSLLW
jgi:hypothetical protein